MDRERVIQLDETPSFPASQPVEEDLRAPEVRQYERLTEVVRRIYVILRSELEGHEYTPPPQFDGGQDRNGRNHKPVWPKLAQFLVQRGYEPLAYMKSQFHMARKDRKPLPNQLMNDAAVQTYERYLKQVRGDLESRLKWEIGSVKSEMLPLQQGLQWTYIAALRWALTNVKTVKASPLTRFCLAVEYGLNDIAASYHDQALFQYAFQKNAYDAAWPEGTIPAVLQQEAQALVTRVLT